MSFCGTTTLTSHASEQVTGHRLHCRCWDCDDCREIRLRELRDLAKSGHPDKFITLTASTKFYDTPEEMAQALVQAWRLVLQRGKREGRFTSIAYLAVFEEHKSGFPHLHILARAPWIDQEWLSERMEQYAHGPRAWIEQVHNTEHASRYVAKYISKGPGRFDGCKRYWRSQNYQVEATGWEKDTPVHDRKNLYHIKPPESLADTFRRVGWTVKWRSWWCFVATPLDPLQPEPWFDAWIHYKPPPEPDPDVVPY